MEMSISVASAVVAVASTIITVWFGRRTERMDRLGVVRQKHVFRGLLRNGAPSQHHMSRSEIAPQRSAAARRLSAGALGRARGCETPGRVPSKAQLRRSFRRSSQLSSLQLIGTSTTGRTRRTRNRSSQPCVERPGRPEMSPTIFEGTSEIQQLVIARAISGLRID